MGGVEQDEDVRSPFTLILVMIVGFVVFCLVMLACAFYGIFVYRRKAARPATQEFLSTFAEQTGASQTPPGTFGMEFPDVNFCREIMRILCNQDGGERSRDSGITEEDYEMIDALTVLNLRKKELKTLKGIEFFTSLTQLDCAGNDLTELDVSRNTMLKQILCFGNQLTQLDVSNNAALVNLYCYNNLLTELDISKSTALETLNCANNRLTELDVSKNTALTGLHCFSNYMDPDPDVSVPHWRAHWSDPGTSWDGSAFQFFPQNAQT